MKKFAMVFPGQGSQALAMLSNYADHPLVQATFAQATEVLGYDLWQLIQHGPEERLNQTEYTQPALLATSIALWRIWCEKANPEPSLLAGHSLGEYTALVCAQALAFTDAISLVAERGRLMQMASHDGAMAAIIGLDVEHVQVLCNQASQGEVLEPANYNANGQIVIAGQQAAIDRALGLAKSIGAKLAKRLSVSVPSHCSLMRPAAERLSEYLVKVKIHKPTIPVINNVDVAVQHDEAVIKDALLRQLYRPVRWVEIIQMMATQNIAAIIECGPGKVLTGLHKRIEPAIPTWPYYDDESLLQAQANLA